VWVSDTQIAEASVDRKSAGGNIKHCFCEELFSCGADFDAWLKNFYHNCELGTPVASLPAHTGKRFPILEEILSLSHLFGVHQPSFRYF
jgi:hypothetical protein